MAAEIERKFLVTADSWHDGSPGTRMVQGYLSQDPDRTVRVRIAGDEAWLTIKGRTRGISRPEFEYAVPAAEARELLELCLPSTIDKTRHRVMHAGHWWEIDVFHGDNEGLIVAEVELAHETVSPVLPPWAGKEVSAERRYFNSCLSEHPYRRWEDRGAGG